MSPQTEPGRAAMGVAARALATRGDGRVLLLKRSRDALHEPGHWDLPGGKIDHGETVHEALVREVDEETGLTVTVGRPLHVGHFTIDGAWVTCIAFACECEDGEVRLSAEHEDFAWIEPSQLPDGDYAPAVREQLGCA